MSRNASRARRARVTAAVAAVLVAGLTLAACSAPEDFWAVNEVSALEADIPQTTDELLSRAEAVVVGTITEAKPGPQQPSGSSDKDVPPIETVDLVIDVESTLKGAPGASLTVSMATGHAGTRALDDAEGQRILWFLTKDETLDRYLTASSRGAWGVDDGAVVTLRDPVGTDDVVPAGVTTLDAAADVVRALLAG